jgi:hypothetical protein
MSPPGFEVTFIMFSVSQKVPILGQAAIGIVLHKVINSGLVKCINDNALQ